MHGLRYAEGQHSFSQRTFQFAVGLSGQNGEVSVVHDIFCHIHMLTFVGFVLEESILHLCTFFLTRIYTFLK